LSKRQFIALIASLAAGIAICAGVFALLIGTANEMFIPVLVTVSIGGTVIVVVTRRTNKDK
jgi:hypothetical protein